MQNIQFINLDNLGQSELIEGIVVHPLKRARRSGGDERGYLVEMFRSDWIDFKYDQLPPAMTYTSFTYKGMARDEDQWHVHPLTQTEGGIEQYDRWGFIGKAIAAVADPKTHKLNLFQIGTGWGSKGFYALLIPPRLYHGFLSAGGVIDDEGKEGVWILNWPDQLYNYDNPSLVEGRVPYLGSEVKLPNGREFNWGDIRSTLGINNG